MTDPFETRLKNLAREFPYPPTPQIAEKVISRVQVKPHPLHFIPHKFALSLVIILMILISLMAVPTVRAAVIEFIQIGIVRIFPFTDGQISPTPGKITVTPTETPLSLIPLLESIAGETSLEDARRKVKYPIPLPTYPIGLGKPDRIFIQDGTITIIVWMDPEIPQRVKMSLHLLPADSWAVKKVNPTIIEFTNVNGQRAAWTTGPYPLIMSNENIEFTRLINGHVLIWVENNITYRLETDLSLEEAVKIAEYLQVTPDISPTP